MKKKIEKFIGNKEFYLAKLKEIGKKFKKSPELQLTTVLALGLLSGALIIYSFTRNPDQRDTTHLTSALAQNILSNQTQMNE